MTERLPLDLHTQTVYADLVVACSPPAFDGRGLSFTKKTVKGRVYWYLNLKLGAIPLQRYLGPDDDATRELIGAERRLWASSEATRRDRARLVDMFLAGDGAGLTQREGQVLGILERAGVFLAGGVLVGTPAFRVLGNNLGVKWAGEQRTRDLDLAADHRYPIAVPDRQIDLRALLIDSGMGFLEVPALKRRHAGTTFTLRNRQFSVEVLTPLVGKPSEEPVFLKTFNTYALPLRYLDYLLDEIEPAVLPTGIGILINVPNPARFALHKLVTAQRRASTDRVKVAKDLHQASQLIEVLIETRPGMLLTAYEAARGMGRGFLRQMNVSLRLLPEQLRADLDEWFSERSPGGTPRPPSR